MQKKKNAKRLMRGFLVLAAVLPLASCVDSSYDFSQDLDLTLGINADGLQLKLGSTEKIMLGDLLEIDGEDESVKLDGKNMYYLVESGSTNVEFNVDPVDVELENAKLETTQDVLTIDDIRKQIVEDTPGVNTWDEFVDIVNTIDPSLAEQTIEKNEIFAPGELATAESTFETDINGIPSDIKEITNIVPEADTKIDIWVDIDAVGLNLGFNDIRSLKVIMPEIMHLHARADDNDGYETVIEDDHIFVVKNFKHEMFEEKNLDNTTFCIGQAYIDSLAFNGCGKVVGDRLPFNDDIRMEADVDFIVNETKTINVLNDKVNVAVHIRMEIGEKNPGTELSTIGIDKVSGRFAPEISPEIEDIDIASGLPDFLDGDDVKIAVANPTIKFDADMANLPLSLKLADAQLKGLTENSDGQLVENGNNAEIPVAGDTINLVQNMRNIVYISQLSTPYAPEVEDSTIIAEHLINATEYAEAGTLWSKHHTDGVDRLILDVPDGIKVDMDKKIQVDSNVVYTLHLGNAYSAGLKYDIYLPFEFTNELRIAYNDSICDLSGDMEDISVGGAKVTADFVNTIPLSLNAKLIPYDYDGREMTDVIVKPIVINAGSLENPTSTKSEISIDMKNSPNALQRLDKFVFKIEASADEAGGELLSTQYLKVNDLRLQIVGDIIYDANED